MIPPPTVLGGSCVTFGDIVDGTKKSYGSMNIYDSSGNQVALVKMTSSPYRASLEKN